MFHNDDRATMWSLCDYVCLGIFADRWASVMSRSGPTPTLQQEKHSMPAPSGPGHERFDIMLFVPEIVSSRVEPQRCSEVAYPHFAAGKVRCHSSAWTNTWSLCDCVSETLSTIGIEAMSQSGPTPTLQQENGKESVPPVVASECG